MSRETILADIRRLASEDGGNAPGQERFERETGISRGYWRGKYWLRWGDALVEAGYSPGRMKEAIDTNVLLLRLAQLARRTGHFPTQAETRMERVSDKSFPNDGVFNRLGNRDQRIALLRAFAQEHPEFNDVLTLLPEQIAAEVPVSEVSNADEALTDGYVYMLKLGKHYKIGKTFSVPRRHREIALELPEKPDVVHSIQTDDPDGIESYWHRRFKSFSTNGEWFELKVQHVKAFKRRKFM